MASITTDNQNLQKIVEIARNPSTTTQTQVIDKTGWALLWITLPDGMSATVMRSIAIPNREIPAQNYYMYDRAGVQITETITGGTGVYRFDQDKYSGVDYLILEFDAALTVNDRILLYGVPLDRSTRISSFPATS